RALEEQVFEEVGDPLARRQLVARPGPDEEPERKGAHVLHFVDEDDRSVIEYVALNHGGTDVIAPPRHPRDPFSVKRWRERGSSRSGRRPFQDFGCCGGGGWLGFAGMIG